MLNLWRLRLAARLTFAVSRESRRRKLKQFFRACRPGPADHLLDIGVAPGTGWSATFGARPVENFLEAAYPWPERIVGLSIDPLAGFTAVYSRTPAVQADGCYLPFMDGSFDIVFTNAVIEHVGDRARQTKFIRECLRVSRHYVFLTAPNRLFPYDVHLGLPFVHWLPRRLYHRFTDDTRLHLLGAWALRRLVPQDVLATVLSPIWAPSTVLLLEKC